jgi:hypothetical protein
VALPLYQGVMINHFDFAAKFYVSGAGNRAQWADQDIGRKIIRPQFLMGQSDFGDRRKAKFVFRSIARSTDRRSMIGTAIPGFPTGNSLGVLEMNHGSPIQFAGFASSMTFDYLLRLRMTGTNVNWFLLSEIPVINPGKVQGINEISIRLAATHITYAPYSESYPSTWIVNPTDCTKARAELDARVALLYGLNESDLAYILSDCDHPAEKLNQKAFTRGLDPRGFWRVDKELSPEGRHTVRTLRAFNAIKEGSYEQIATESFDKAEAAEYPGAEYMKERELVLAHRTLISRIRSFTQKEVEMKMPKAAVAKPEQADKKGQGFLF